MRTQSGGTGGSGLLGSIPLGGIGAYERDFQAVKPGCIGSMNLRLNFSIISAGAAFVASVLTAQSAAAEGVDDTDVITAAIASALSWRIDASTYLFQNFTMPQLRTILGALNQRDFTGTFLNGASIPISSGAAKGYSIEITIPLSLAGYLNDGENFAQGSERIKSGSAIVNFSNPSTGIVLTNGTATLSAVTMTIETIGVVGQPTDLGPTWHAERNLNYPNTVSLKPAPRLFLADILPAATNPVAENGYTVTGQEDLPLVGVSFLDNRYQQQKQPVGGYDITQRCTPIYFMRTNTPTTEWPIPMRPTIAAPTASNLGFYDVQIVVDEGQAVMDVATAAGGNAGGVSISHVAPRSLAGGGTVPAAAAPYTRKQVTPGGSNPVSPAKAAATAAAHVQLNRALPFMRTGTSK
jgi:hypothetical protein